MKKAVIVKRRRTLAIFAILVMVLASGACGSEDDTGIVFNADFETGKVSQRTWAAQCANTGLPPTTGEPPNVITRGNVFPVQDVAASGSWASRIDLPASNRSACELLHGRTLGTGHGSPPVEEWYAQEFRLPTNFQAGQAGGWGLTITQYAYQSIHSAPLQLLVHATDIEMIVEGGACVRAEGCAHSTRQDLLPTAPEQGIWYQVLVRIKRSTSNDGIVQAWIRKRGQTSWFQGVDISGGPTVQWHRGSTVSESDTVYDKVGGYRGSSSLGVSIWHDNFCVTTSRAAAESCF